MTIVYLSALLVSSVLLVVNAWELRRLRRQIEEQRARLLEACHWLEGSELADAVREALR